MEEKWNVRTHAFGWGLSVIGWVLLVIKGWESGELRALVAFIVFGTSMVMLYAASTCYHNCKSAALRYKLKILDHVAIYLLIAGTYTPFTLVTLHGRTGWILFAVVWSIALLGVVLKLFFTGRYKLVSTLMYVAMGWVIIFAAGPLMDHLPPAALYWIVAGGIAYTLGAVIYSLSRIPFNHAIFHVFVLLGSFSHFMAIYFYLI